MPFIKAVVTLMIVATLTLKIRLKHVLVMSCVALAVYAGGLYIGYSRLGRQFDPESSSRLYPFTGEAFHANLSLLIATRNLEAKIYHPWLPVAVAIFILPSWSVDKPALVARWFDRDGYAQDVGYQFLSPVGATHFVADALVAYGPYFLILVAVTALLVYLPFAGRLQPYHVLLFLLLLSACHNLWRDSYLIAVKEAVEIYGLEYFVLWSLTRKNRLRAMAQDGEGP
jgi:hypothetical protein